LQKDSQKLKPGDTHYTQWFSSLTKFIAVFYKKYPTTCLSGLLRLVVKSLSNSESLDLLVLRELLAKMGGCETMLELSHVQLEGLSGGKTLQNETMGGQVKEVAVKKSIRILRDELTKTNTALPLLYLTSAIRNNIIFNMETNKLKLVSHIYDICQDVLMQFTDFLVQGTLSTINSAADKIKALEAIAGIAVSFLSLYKCAYLPRHVSSVFSDSSIDEGADPARRAAIVYRVSASAAYRAIGAAEQSHE
jgi:hypothetical protein